MSNLITIAIFVLIGLMARYANDEIGGYVEPDLEDAFPLGGSHVISGGKLLKEPAVGYTTRECAEALALMASSGTGSGNTGKSDDIYDEPQAMYPMEMRNEG